MRPDREFLGNFLGDSRGPKGKNRGAPPQFRYYALKGGSFRRKRGGLNDPGGGGKRLEYP